AKGMRKIHLWQIAYTIGLTIVLSVFTLEGLGFHHFPTIEFDVIPYLDLIGGIMLIAGSCEAFVLAVEGIAQNMNMTDYVSGIYASLAATIPELSVLAFLILNKEFELAWVLALSTIFVNSIVFATYSLFLPKDETGNFKLPDAIMWVGSDLLTVGAVISLTVGISMLLLQVFVAPILPGQVMYFTFDELLVFGGALICVFIAYLYNITKYYGKCDPKSEKPGIACKVHDPIPKQTVVIFLVMASAGALLGGEAVAQFAGFAQVGLGLNFIQAALLLVVFSGLPEYIIVVSSHRKDQIDIALSNAFGGIVQVFFVVFGFTLIASGLALGAIPIDLYSVVLVIFTFPTLFILRTKITDDAKINNLEAIAMIAVFVMMLYILLAFGTQTIVAP
ncbi:MAG: hypothetical protein P1Q69_10610, partial [Candidatus Thorarchaeota archaeon]|nr:hypothetical protein [Candidatus Thorarchaeota archaeon]